MAKRIIMVPPFDVLTGNLSGQQSLKYAENDNRAYEAPNGSQGARNYKTRYIGARRSDGTTYFSVRRKNTAVLNGQTRMAMGLTAMIAVIKSAIMALPPTSLGLVPWTHIQRCYAAYKEANPDADDAKSLTKYFDTRVRRLLMYKQENYLFHESGVAGGWTLNNPFYLGSANALVVKNSMFVKFASLFAWENDTDLQTQVVTKLPGGAYFYIDSNVFFVGKQKVNGEVIIGGITQGKGSTNPNMNALYTDVTIDDSQADDVLYQGIPVYNAQGEIQQGETPIIDGQKLTTIAPEA